MPELFFERFGRTFAADRIESGVPETLPALCAFVQLNALVGKRRGVVRYADLDAVRPAELVSENRRRYNRNSMRGRFMNFMGDAGSIACGSDKHPNPVIQFGNIREMSGDSHVRPGKRSNTLRLTDARDGQCRAISEPRNNLGPNLGDEPNHRVAVQADLLVNRTDKQKSRSEE